MPARFSWLLPGFYRLIKSRESVMAKMCEVCGKAPVFGNRVSHAHNVSSRRWMPNLQRVRVMVGSAVKRMQVCTRCIRTGAIKKAAR